MSVHAFLDSYSCFCCAMFAIMFLFYCVRCQNDPAAVSPREISTVIVQLLNDRLHWQNGLFGQDSPCSSVSAPALSGSGQIPCGHGWWWVVSIAATKPHPAPQQRLIALQWSGSRWDLMGILGRRRKAKLLITNTDWHSVEWTGLLNLTGVNGEWTGSHVTIF